MKSKFAPLMAVTVAVAACLAVVLVPTSAQARRWKTVSAACRHTAGGSACASLQRASAHKYRVKVSLHPGKGRWMRPANFQIQAIEAGGPAVKFCKKKCAKKKSSWSRVPRSGMTAAVVIRFTYTDARGRHHIYAGRNRGPWLTKCKSVGAGRVCGDGQAALSTKSGRLRLRNRVRIRLQPKSGSWLAPVRIRTADTVGSASRSFCRKSSKCPHKKKAWRATGRWVTHASKKVKGVKDTVVARGRGGRIKLVPLHWHD